MEILNNLVCVWIESSMWAGRKKLHIDDLNDVSETAIPPEDIASLGSKRIFPREPLRPFYAIRKRAERLCLSIGTRFMGGYAIPADQRQHIAAELNKLKDEYQAEVQKLLVCYDKALSEFIAEYPKWGGMIEKAATPRSEIARHFAFLPHIMGINVPDGMEKASNIEEAIAGIPSQVMREVATMARSMLQEDLRDKDVTNVRVIGTMRKWYGKVVSMSFVDRNLAAIATRIENILNGFPATGEIAGADFQRMLKFVQVLADATLSVDLRNYPDVNPVLAMNKPTVAKATRSRVYKGSFIDGTRASI